MQVAGPRLMAKREAFNVKSVVQLYNVLMVVANLYFMIQFLRHSYLGGGYNIFCQGRFKNVLTTSTKGNIYLEPSNFF